MGTFDWCEGNYFIISGIRSEISFQDLTEANPSAYAIFSSKLPMTGIVDMYGEASMSLGGFTLSIGHYAHTEGFRTVALKYDCHSEGYKTSSVNNHSHA
jgi:hypothetical protein